MTLKANPPTRAQALSWAQDQLAGGDSPALDSELILAHCLQVGVASLYTWPEKPLETAEWDLYQVQISRRKEGEPVAYIMGEQGFWTLNLKTHPSTLIPRPETELLVEIALGLSLPANCQLLDLGTGTGAIALALAAEHSSWQITGVDYSADAVALAQQNAELNLLQQVKFQQGDWADGLQPGWHCIVSNPPYIDPQDPHLQHGDVRFEPLSALIADDHGLADIKTIARQSFDLLLDDGWLLLEHGYDQGQAVREILIDAGFVEVRTEVDLGKRDRVTLGRKQVN